MKGKMNELVKRTFDNINDFLLEDNKNMHIESILYDDKTHATYTIATDGNEICYSFDPYSVYEPNGYNLVPEWDYNFDYYIYDLLDKGCEIGYMSDDLHYGLWNSINELYPNDLEFTDGVLKYVDYCKNNNITKDYLDSRFSCDIDDIMPLFDSENIRVLYVEPNKLSTIRTIHNDTSTLKEVGLFGKQNIVNFSNILKDKNTLMIFDELESKNETKPNRIIGNEVIYNSFFIAAVDSVTGKFKSLSNEQISKYKNFFDDQIIDRLKNENYNLNRDIKISNIEER